MALLGIPIGLVMLTLGVRGILRMLGIASDEADHFFCTCNHAKGRHRKAWLVGYGAPMFGEFGSCRHCPCVEYDPALAY